jgi:thiamine-phosphate pyrophosphorylase
MIKMPKNGLYAITNDSNNLEIKVKQAILGGASIIQYRDKSFDYKKRKQQGRLLLKICHTYNIPLIINDDVNLAKEINADGVHLGKNDDNLKNVRKVLKDKIIGISCYNNLALAQQAQNNGADYIAFGSFFTSLTKPNAVIATLDLLKQARKKIVIPIVAIGGITPNNTKQLLDAGTDFIAVINGIFGQSNIRQATHSYISKF